MSVNDRISVFIRQVNDADTSDPTEIVDLSPLGIILNTKTVFKYGDSVVLEVVVYGEVSIFSGIVLESSLPPGQVLVRYCTNPQASEHDERRRENRWICPSNLLPKAVAVSPGRFNEFITFRVRNISKGGLELQAGPEAGFLVTGMILNLAVSLPLVGTASVSTKVLRTAVTSVGGIDTLSLGSEIVSISQHDRDLIGQYLIQFTELDSIESVRSETTTAVHQNVKFGYAKSKQDFDLIRNSNTHDARIRFSLENRIAMCFSNNTLASLASVRFPKKSISTISGDSVRADQIVEIDEIGLMGSDKYLSLILLLSNVVSTAITLQRPFLKITTDQFSAASMSKLGFDQIALNTYIGHPINSLSGGTTNPIFWNLIWRNQADTLLQIDKNIAAGMQRRMLFVYRIIGPLASLYSKRLPSRTQSNDETNR